jgi:hypothetical protein
MEGPEPIGLDDWMEFKVSGWPRAAGRVDKERSPRADRIRG